MQIDWWTLALQAVNFLVLVWLLSHFLFRPVKRVIEQRQRRTEEAMRDVAEKQSEADAARRRYESDRASLAEERQTLLKKLHDEMAKEREQVISEAGAEAERLKLEARDTLARERRDAFKALQGEIAALAGEMTAILLREAAVPPGGDALLKGAGKYLAGLEASEMERLRDDLADEGAVLSVVTAEALSTVDQEAFREMLRGQLGAANQIEFRTVPALLGGLELHFPHHRINLSWAERLAELRAGMLANGVANGNGNAKSA